MRPSLDVEAHDPDWIRARNAYAYSILSTARETRPRLQGALKGGRGRSASPGGEPARIQSDAPYGVPLPINRSSLG